MINVAVYLSNSISVSVVIGGSGGGGEVEIIDQDSNVIDTITAPGSYSVIVFSGIDGGVASTTFSNSIIAT